MQAAAIRFDLRIPGSRSLKHKRAAIRPIVDGLRHRFHVSVAEVGYHNQWQRSVVGVAVVAESLGRLTEVLETVERFVRRHHEVEILEVDTTFLEHEEA